MGGVFGGNGAKKQMEQEQQQMQEELEKEKAERKQKARQLMLQRLQVLRRRGGAGMLGQAADQRDLLGGA